MNVYDVYRLIVIRYVQEQRGNVVFFVIKMGHKAIWIWRKQTAKYVVLKEMRIEMYLTTRL